MAAKKKSKYASVSSARAQSTATYPTGGHYLWLIQAVEEGVNFKKQDFVANRSTNIFTFEDSVSSIDYDRGQTAIPPTAVGTTLSDVMLLGNVAFDGRIKNLAMAAANLTEADFEAEEYDGQIIDEMVGPDQPVAGFVVEVRVEQTVKRDARDPIENKDTYHKVNYIRRLSFSEVLETVGENVTRLIPNIREEIEAENATAEA